MTQAPLMSGMKTAGNMAEHVEEVDTSARMSELVRLSDGFASYPGSHHVHDRVYRSHNISLALPRFSRDLHLDPQQAGTVAGIFFWGYIALQSPLVAIWQSTGAPRSSSASCWLHGAFRGGLWSGTHLSRTLDCFGCSWSG